ncbi:MAG TPA: PKD domain-containing protein, partial [Candidatus Sulfotelmatobacter sp.]|nr:PKD domain-containing protein [Candidatus Sulfotelmatobacter sp.]
MTRLRFWILAAGLTWFSYAAGAAITSLISNGDFESGSLAGWSAGGGYAASTNLVHSGGWSARSTNADMNRSFSTVVGCQYKLAGWIQIASESGSDWGGFRLEAQSSSYASLAHSGYLTQSGYGTNWFKVAITFTATSTTSRFCVGYFGGTGRQMIVYVDDLVAFEKPATNSPPQITASLTPTTLAGLPQTLQYAVSGDDPDGAIKRVDWDFGDGAHSPELSGARRVGVPGEYEARVRVTDEEGTLVTQSLHWSATDDQFPTLTVAEPASPELVVSNALLPLSGSTGGTGVSVLVSTDRGYAATAGGSASAWSASVALQPGLNRVLVQARDAGGRVVTVERRVRWVPGDPLAITSLTEATNVVPRWETFEATFQLTNTAATHPHFPFDPAPPAGLEWVDGVTVDGLFTPDNWVTIYRRPAFLLQTYQRAAKGSEEWLYPQATGPVWCVRFAPPEPGQWQYRIEAREAKGSAQSTARTFTVIAPANPFNHGPVRVARNDTRYFEFADGTPFFGPGHALGFSAERYSFDALDQFNQIGTNNQNFFRWWISGHLWGSAWQPWNSRTLGYSGYLPANGLSLESAYGNGLAALKLSTNNPIMFQGWMSGHSGVVRGRTYRVRVRWCTENVTGPLTSGQPYGLCLKFTGWPEPGQTGALPVLIPHVNGHTPWHVAETNFTATGDYLSNLEFILENCTGGVGYVDECGVYEVLAGGGLGP